MDQPKNQTTKALAKKNGINSESQPMADSLKAILDLPMIPKNVKDIMKHLGIKVKLRNIRDSINLVAVAQALNGSYSHYKEIFDREDGRPTPTLEEIDDEISLIIKVKKSTVRAAKRKVEARRRLEKDITPKTVEIKAKVIGGHKKTPKRTTKTKRKLGGNK